uniref:SWIB domain-containing protein n=1 Tax=Quercus lobata TaxID=97700 RepID=A0A7N2MXW4_QUELO
MATSLRLFSSFSSAKAASLMPKSSPSLMLYCSPANLRIVRTVTSATVSSNEAPQKRAPRGIMKPRPVSPEMQDLVGVPEISRTQALKQIWAHIKEHNLQVGYLVNLAVFSYSFKAIIDFGKHLMELIFVLLNLLSLSVCEMDTDVVACLRLFLDPENKRIIVCDDKLKKIFGGRERIGFLEIAGLISPHFIK